jgi:hypothetical protein
MSKSHRRVGGQPSGSRSDSPIYKPLHAAQEPYGEFYEDPETWELAAWLSGAEWARDPETLEREKGDGDE